MRRIFGFFYGRHPIHMFWFGRISERFDSASELTIWKEMSSSSWFLSKFVRTFFHKSMLLWSSKNFFNKTTLFLEGPLHLSLWSFLLPRVTVISLAADPLYFRLANGFFPDSQIRFYKLFFAGVDYFLANGRMVIGCLRKLWVPESKIAYMPPFIEESRKDHIDESGVFLGASNFGLKNLVTIANGDDAEYKGLPLLNSLASDISKTGWKISVAWKWSEDVRSQFPNLVFLGLMPYEDLFRYLSENASVWIIAWTGESFSCAALEMAYMGLPVLCGTNVWYSEIYQDLALDDLIFANVDQAHGALDRILSSDLSFNAKLKSHIAENYTERASALRLDRFLDSIKK